MMWTKAVCLDTKDGTITRYTRRSAAGLAKAEKLRFEAWPTADEASCLETIRRFMERGGAAFGLADEAKAW